MSWECLLPLQVQGKDVVGVGISVCLCVCVHACVYETYLNLAFQDSVSFFPVTGT